MKKYITASPEESYRVGELIAESLEKKSATILLGGDLGAGKTVVAGGIVKGVTGKAYTVTSPTFNIVNEYKGERDVNHFDLYRIADTSELENIGIYEYLYSDAVNVLEWPERAENLFD